MGINTPRIGLYKPDPLESMSDVGTWLNPNMDKLDTAAGVHPILDEFSFPVSPYVGQMVYITNATSNAFANAFMVWTGTEWRHRGRKGAGFKRSVSSFVAASGNNTVTYTSTDNVNFTATSTSLMTAITPGLYMFAWECVFAPYDRTLSFEKFMSMTVQDAGGVTQFGQSDGNGQQEGPTPGTTDYAMAGAFCFVMDVGWRVSSLIFQGSGSNKTVDSVKIRGQLIGTDVTYTTPG